jgi:hypothetical protein
MGIIVFKKRPLSTLRRAIERRVSYCLSKEGLRLHKCSSRSSSYQELGEYYISDLRTGGLIATHQELHGLALEHGAVKAAQSFE